MVGKCSIKEIKKCRSIVINRRLYKSPNFKVIVQELFFLLINFISAIRAFV